MKCKPRFYSGQKNTAVTPVETAHRAIARSIAAEGIVLLKNEGHLLPLRNNQTVALYGEGIAHQIKGGTGSGDVNERDNVYLLQGLLSAGVTVVNEKAAAQARIDYDQAQKAWAQSILDKMEDMNQGSDMGFFKILAETPFIAPDTLPVVAEDAKKADAVVYMISRIAGEGRDRYDTKGDYYLTDKEEKELADLSELNKNIVVLINTGSQIDVKSIRANPSVKSILFVSQGGMEMGNSIADVLTGAITPSGKLTDTWAINYEDFPNSKTFSHNNGNVDNEIYSEGIYVGYRYFDSFGIESAYPFGYGISYTDFAIKTLGVSASGKSVLTTVQVTNTGSTWSGKEVVEVYAACPQHGMKKEFKRLIGFGKTKRLAPGESQTMTITSPVKMLASFSESAGAWIVEKGMYGILAGTSSASYETAGLICVETDTVIESVPHICPRQEHDGLEEIVRPDSVIEQLTAAMMADADKKGLTPIVIVPAAEESFPVPASEFDAEARRIAAQLTEDEMIALMMGEITKGQDNIREGELVTTGIFVPGAAGETTGILEEKYGVPAVSLADGPAGLRLIQKYDVDKESGLIYGNGIMSAINSNFATSYDRPNAETYYQYATAIPVGTLLASSWDVSLLEKIGSVVGEEMAQFGVSWWLAPGMNIHRNPLCGRNFEYYSEDPLVSGVIAAAITKGVQAAPGVGTTIKHFAANNQEDNRTGSNSVVSERALREIYLRGFEIAIKSAQPMAIMTSYNLINGTHTANSYCLNTECARNEWGFAGIIMTDWTTTSTRYANHSVSHLCGKSGNDLIMPAHQDDVTDYKAAFAEGTITRAEAEECCFRMIRLLLQTSRMEGVKPYSSQFDLQSYVTVE
ncbi:MAG: glycoside hydrolase family 3 C-terminal domain-containing protein [Treponemataceae bacterium]|nr:glycoside hydrolase family 3 C-terminal domain-containing protein [Treponemataceae bacterium]